MKKLISCILALLLLTTAAFAVPGDSCVVLGEELTLGETDGIFTALGVERGTAMELALSRPDAETYFSDVPEKAASVGVFVRIRSGGEGLSLSLSNITGRGDRHCGGAHRRRGDGRGDRRRRAGGDRRARHIARRIQSVRNAHLPSRSTRRQRRPPPRRCARPMRSPASSTPQSSRSCSAP